MLSLSIGSFGFSCLCRLQILLPCRLALILYTLLLQVILNNLVHSWVQQPANEENEQVGEEGVKEKASEASKFGHHTRDQANVLLKFRHASDLL